MTTVDNFYHSRIVLFSCKEQKNPKMVPVQLKIKQSPEVSKKINGPNGCFYLSINFRDWQEIERKTYVIILFTTFNKTFCSYFNPSDLNIRFEVCGKRFGMQFFKRNEKTIISPIISDSSKTTKEINSRHFQEGAGRKPRKIIWKHSC